MFPGEHKLPGFGHAEGGRLIQADPFVSATPSRAAPLTMRPGDTPTPLLNAMASPGVTVPRRQGNTLGNERALVLAQAGREVLRLPAHLCPIRAVDHARAHRVIASHVSMCA